VSGGCVEGAVYEGCQQALKSDEPPTRARFGYSDDDAFAGALSEVGRFLGYRVTVCDARPVFATPARFPHADDVVADWPHRYLAATEVDARTAVCVLTHDAKFDIPLLRLALSLPVGYVGAMGSRRTHAHRLELLREADVPEEQLARLHSPTGLGGGKYSTAANAPAQVSTGPAQAQDSTGVHELSRQDSSLIPVTAWA